MNQIVFVQGEKVLGSYGMVVLPPLNHGDSVAFSADGREYAGKIEHCTWEFRQEHTLVFVSLINVEEKES